MKWHSSRFEFSTRGKGLYTFTDQVNTQLRAWNVRTGICFLSCPHTSASLTINESYDPSAQADLEKSLEKLVSDNERWYTHDLEGADVASNPTIQTKPTPLNLFMAAFRPSVRKVRAASAARSRVAETVSSSFGVNSCKT